MDTMNEQEKTQELYRRYLEAKAKGEKSVYAADLYPDELMSAGRRSIGLLDRLFSSAPKPNNDIKNSEDHP